MLGHSMTELVDKFTRYMTEKGLPVFDNPLPSKDHAYKKSLFASSPFS